MRFQPRTVLLRVAYSVRLGALRSPLEASGEVGDYETSLSFGTASRRRAPQWTSDPRSTSMRDRRLPWAWLALAMLCAPPGTAAPQKPNVVIFLADDLGWADVGLPRRPDRHACPSTAWRREGMPSFTASTTTPICSPTRAALMTGRDPMRLGVAYGVILPWHTIGIHPDEHFMPESFRARATRPPWWASGTSATRSRPITPTSAASSTSTGTSTPRSATSRPSPNAERCERISRSNGESIDDEGYETFLLGKEGASRYIRGARQDQRPFFLYMPFIAPHTPLDAPG